MMSVTKVVTIIKSLTTQKIFRRAPQVKKQLGGGELGTDGYDASTVGKHGNENIRGAYAQQQGDAYQKLYRNHPLALF
jgi:REP element-mobilizing transposase RayT